MGMHQLHCSFMLAEGFGHYSKGNREPWKTVRPMVTRGVHQLQGGGWVGSK